MTLRICSRSDDVVEPLLKPQWYVNMKDMAAKAHRAVETGDLIINPKLSESEFKRWMENIRDWCISRQLWWGHQAPVYYVTVEGEKQSVREIQCPTDISRVRVNGGCPGDRRTKPDKRRWPNSLVNHLRSSETQMCSIRGFHRAFGHFRQWDGRTAYFFLRRRLSIRMPTTCNNFIQIPCSKRVGISCSSGSPGWSC